MYDTHKALAVDEEERLPSKQEELEYLKFGAELAALLKEEER